MEHWKPNFSFSVWMLKYPWHCWSSQRWSVFLFSEAIMFWLEFQLILLSWPEACKAGLCPRVFGTFSFPADWNAGWVGFQHPCTSSCILWCSSYGEPELTNKHVTPCIIPCAAVLEYFFLKCRRIKLSSPFFSLFLALNRVPDPLRQLKMKRTSAQWLSTPLTWERHSRSWMNCGGTLLT